MSETLRAQSRRLIGKKVKTLRAQGQTPAVIYGHGRSSQSISVKTDDFRRIFDRVGTSALVDVAIDEEKPIKVLLHEPQVHPVTGRIVHGDLYVVKMTEKLQTEIPLAFVGEASAVTDLDGTLTIVVDALAVECLPDKLVPSLPVDISTLKTFDDIIRLADIVIPDGIAVLADPDEVIATITPPRSEEELAELEQPVAGEEADKAAVEAVEVTEEKPTEETQSEETGHDA